ncbi:FecR domain-containing protein [Flavihumibacter sp. CACIAM 22H1]|uniref:FecR family protein n=1 Tax=Flavihumibacter sp. CACIAM 22H1 TaxID=1812911 RepID=UPI0007A8FCD8|nr:FecR domain-containing protein [Flavihumibacter sp. CACIAM 22H1]KYP15045.1 MAG: hypothetical protein A1D16_01245 [Flavihumibacter sp. CACIAM 22H1]
MRPESPQPVIDELLVKYLLGEATPAEISKATDWISASAENERYFTGFKAIWDSSRELAAKSTVDVDAAWQRMREKIGRKQEENLRSVKREEEREGKVEIRRIGAEWRRVAAVLVVVFTGILAWMIYRQTTATELLEIASLQETRQQPLSDGSVITLNKGAALRYPSSFSGNKRTVELKGEAFFAIQPDASRPFEVRVNKLTVRVLGTSFNIRETDSTTIVIVETGRVEVSDEKQSIQLTAGEKATIRKNGGTWTKDQQPDKLYQYYRTRTFSCDNTPLWKLVDVLNEAYDAQIIISNPAIRTLPITTVFEEQPLEEILSIIAQTLDITITRKDAIIYVQ